ncbi:MAG: ABC transporter substrate-binding protein [Planctomycetes bacterium]|nr:ABC transporter substrate-binding protein [Planctomycetota bacterium]
MKVRLKQTVLLAAVCLAVAGGCRKRSSMKDETVSQATLDLIKQAGSESAPSARVYHEAPMLAEQVKQGKLPPVWKRLPENPMVVPVYEEIGQYGGTWHRMMKGTSDVHAFTRITYGNENMLRWSVSPKDGIIANLVERWGFEDNYKIFRMHLRKGLKWSDGYPFTTADIVFWWRHIANDPRITAAVPKIWCPGGKPMIVKAISDTTIEFHFAEPYPVAEKLMSFKAGQWPLGMERYGLYAPKHYLEEALPVEGENPLTPSGEKRSYELFERRAYDFNPNRPAMTAWVITEMDEGTRVVATRNPYYWKVDPQGNQLPYIDNVQFEFFFNPEMMNFRCLTGEVDMQLRHIQVQNLPLFRDFAAMPSRNFRIMYHKTTSANGICINPEWHSDPRKESDAVVRSYFKNKDFRRALSLAIDRDLIDEVGGRVTRGKATFNLDVDSPYYTEIKGISKYLRYDVDEANRLLDSVGLDKRDKDGFRVMSNGETMSIIYCRSGSASDPIAAVEMVAAQWRAVGIKTTVRTLDRSLMFDRDNSGLVMVRGAAMNGLFPLLSDDSRFGIGKTGSCCWAYGIWYRSGGKKGIEPPDEIKRHQQIYDELKLTTDTAKFKKLVAEVVRDNADSVWHIPLAGPRLWIGVVKNDFRNVPIRASYEWSPLYSPGNLNPEQFFFKR